MMIGVDVGGTFTDLVAADPLRGLRFVKTPSTPDDPSRGVLDALKLLADELELTLDTLLPGIELFIHGTTVATNILVERRGARLGLITTQGFRDLLELREGARDNRYALRTAPPTPVIPRPLRLEVRERVAPDGTAVLPLDPESLDAAIATLRAAGVDGVVVCFLHAHRRPAHEQAVRAAIAATGWEPFISLGHEILGREGEYDRLSTAVVNGYVGPGLKTYLNRLFGRLTERGITVPVQVMQSNGGVLPVAEAGTRAVGAVTSGPAGGAMAGALYARALGLPQLVTYDTGGTSTDICIIQDGVPVERNRAELAGLRIAAPAIEINPLGIGGGSIARIDAGGMLDIGPMSAGAVPGPACFGKGGTRATLTDANLVLGFISGETFLGGRMRLDVAAARAVITQEIAAPLGIGVDEAAYAIHVLATSRITEGIRLATVRRGMDPRDFALMSFGGAGGLHANAVARELEIPTAIIPAMASVLSALGFLAADVRQDLQQTVNAPIRDLHDGRLAQVFGALEVEGRAALETSRSRGGHAGDIHVRRFADCRYERQVHTIPVPLEPDDTAADLERRFVATYEDLYHHTHLGEPGIVETCRVAVFNTLPKLALPVLDAAPAGGVDCAAARTGERRIFIGAAVMAPVYWFEEIRRGMVIAGPALIDSAATSVLVLPGSTATLDATGSLCLSDAAAPAGDRAC
ncbi:hydantoinase/oxoprolinase family protein [Xanthobacter sp. 91]|uniref:hydantoinase/oxoprolinase family protein n=1 Tax=Xanthobacter sp. 91 TaxID=1117244 RepID=UPI000497E682|nr:hydantoinase/oxoprolinase family protein [Xanthobacter sp. 91]